MISAISGIGSVTSTTGVAAKAAAAPTGAMSFGQVLADVATGAVNTMKAGEATAISGITGNTSVQKVVESVMQAEQALQTAIAVRDKMVSAYQEISRMAI
ncbi:MAG: flagellar hook-basal body complex protein FliE [Rhizobiales bacterium]|nr:flagellar hook-basal body complex protein FliE [Hyphomicrobiales bacterium]